MAFPEFIKRELLIQMKQQIFLFLKSQVQNITATFQNVLPVNDNPDNSGLDIERDRFDEDNNFKKSYNERKKMNLSNFLHLIH